MFKYLLVPLLISISIFLSCNEKKAINNYGVSEEPGTYLPLKDLILGELAGLDTLQLNPLYTITRNNKTDSVWMKRGDIMKFSAPFLLKGTDTVTMKKFFIAKSFLDRSLNSVTISYDPGGTLPDSIALRHCDIYIDPVTQTIKRIYMVEESKDGDHNKIQLTWKPGSSATITTIGKETNEAQVKVEKMIWNFDTE